MSGSRTSRSSASCDRVALDVRHALGTAPLGGSRARARSVSDSIGGLHAFDYPPDRPAADRPANGRSGASSESRRSGRTESSGGCCPVRASARSAHRPIVAARRGCDADKPCRHVAPTHITTLSASANPLTYVAFAVLIVLPMLILLSACAHPAAQPADAPAPQVTVAEVIARDVTEWDEFTGRLEAVNTVAVRPRVSGFVAAVRFDEGAIVRRGDLLFQIDPRPFQAEVDRLRAELARARATVQRADLGASARRAPRRRERDVARGTGAARRASRRSRPRRSRPSRPRCARPN